MGVSSLRRCPLPGRAAAWSVTVSVELRREIQQIEASVAAMARAVETRVQTALEAWASWDADLASSIRQADDEIDRMDIEIEERCVTVLALHQPVASDLRTVLAILRIVTSLERAADLARSIAKRVLKLTAHDKRGRPDASRRFMAIDPPEAVIKMGNGALKMIRDTMRALENDDVELARSVRRQDPEIDEANRAVFRWAVEGVQKDPAAAEAYFSTIVMARAIERIGDMAANIAEDVIYAVGGSVVRHSPI
jgi:phosphate transport system protein